MLGKSKESALVRVLSRCRFLGRLVVASVLAAIVLFAVPGDAVRAATVYQFGVVPQFQPRKLAEIWLPILDELEARTGFKFEMAGAPKIPDFEADFLGGKFDFAYMNPYHAAQASDSQGYVPLVYDGGRKLFGILVVRADSAVKDLTALAGQKVAFPSPNSLGAALLMRAELKELHGISVDPLYVQTHSSVYFNVVLKRTLAGGGVMGTFDRQEPKIRDQLRVLYKTRSMSPHPVTAHPRVPVTDRELVRRAFLDLGKTEDGKALLSKVPIKKIAIANPADYEELKTWGLEKYYVKN